VPLWLRPGIVRARYHVMGIGPGDVMSVT
jgi:hypothetical protein